MVKNQPAFLTALAQSGPRFSRAVAQVFDLAMTPGELDARTKVLIALALDALAGAAEGVAVLAETARKMGVAEGQIAEALRLAYLNYGLFVSLFSLLLADHAQDRMRRAPDR